MKDKSCGDCKWFRPADDPPKFIGRNVPSLCRNPLNDTFLNDAPWPGAVSRMPRLTSEHGICAEHLPKDTAQ